jgi:hypothetical protein
MRGMLNPSGGRLFDGLSMTWRGLLCGLEIGQIAGGRDFLVFER